MCCIIYVVSDGKPDWANIRQGDKMSKLGSLYKFTRPGGVAPFAIGFYYPLPHDGRPGDWTEPVGKLVMCENGYHACRRDDVIWWFDAELWEIEARGDYLTQGDFESKVCCRSVRLVRRVETWNERTQRLLACDYVEHVLPIFERARPGDDRVRNCIAVCRLYADGQATDEELAAAQDVAMAAARDARATEAKDAAWAAADVACAAATAAAWAAQDAARAAATEAGDAARAAERAWQINRFWQRLEE